MKRASNSDVNPDFCNKVALVDRNESPNGVALVNSLKSSKKGCDELVQLAMEIQKADIHIHANASNKLQVIAKQVRYLQEEARRILAEAKLSSDLHHAACNFVKVPGNVYHLYLRQSGQKYFSLLSPEEWTSPHQFVGSYRLEHDYSWTSAQKIQEKDGEQALIDKIIGAQDRSAFSNALETPMDL